MARKRGKHFLAADEGHYLNLIPYLDIMVNLVLFMLLNITSFLSFTILNASIPQLSTSPDQIIEERKKEDLLLVLRVRPDGYRLEPTVTGGEPIARQTFTMVTDEETKEKVYNTQALNAFLITVKERFKEENKILIISDPNVTYESIIKTMDATRETAPGIEDLFPEVTLSI